MKTKLRALFFAAGLLAASGALATPQICPIVPPEKWMPREKVTELALGLGYDSVSYVQPDGGCWVAYARKDGRNYEIYFHPETGEVVRTESGS